MKHSFSSAVNSAKKDGSPLQVVGTINAYSAIMAKQIGFQALYLSGAGVANASYGLPDLGITSLDNVLEDVNRITSACDLPILVDIDTGFGGIFNINQTIKLMIKYGASAVHIEDQQLQKRCGHRPNKALISTKEMSDRVKAAVDAKFSNNFTIMARTDAYGVEGLEAAINRAGEYLNSGADMIFAEAMHSLDDYKKFTKAIQAPVLANITEFGQTPLFTLDELASANISVALYPLSAFRAMNKAACNVYKSILRNGGQSKVLDTMQTRAELYDFLGYHTYEQKIDKYFLVND